MTNEELCLEIQQGNKEYILPLWEQVHRFIVIKARDYFVSLDDCRGITEEDLIQSGYFALLDAVAGYDPERGAHFIGYLAYHLHRQFGVCAGLVLVRDREDPISSSISLDTPIDDEDFSTLGELQPDPHDITEEPEERLYRAQLHVALENAMEELNPKDADVIRKRFYQNMTLKEAAALAGVSLDRIRQREQKGLRILRKHAKKNGLNEYIEQHTPYFKKSAFRYTFTSPVEDLAILRERLRERYENKQEQP